MLIATTKTKKDLRTKVGEQAERYLRETSIFGPEMKPGATVCCTNHPKRSWFAQVDLDESLKIKRVR